MPIVKPSLHGKHFLREPKVSKIQYYKIDGGWACVDLSLKDKTKCFAMGRGGPTIDAIVDQPYEIRRLPVTTYCALSLPQEWQVAFGLPVYIPAPPTVQPVLVLPTEPELVEMPEPIPQPVGFDYSPVFLFIVWAFVGVILGCIVGKI
jgi:hypothetical protein